MVRVDFRRWGQTVEDLRHASLHAEHPRTRERFQALYFIAGGQFNATACAAHIGRQDETVLAWVRLYNRHGPDALAYRRTGGRAPLLTATKPVRSSPRSKKPARRTTACPVTTGP